MHCLDLRAFHTVNNISLPKLCTVHIVYCPLRPALRCNPDRDVQDVQLNIYWIYLKFSPVFLPFSILRALLLASRWYVHCTAIEFCSVLQCIVLHCIALCVVYYLPSWQGSHKARVSVGEPGAVYHTSSDPLKIHCTVLQCTVPECSIWPACLCQVFAVKMSVIALLKCPYSHQVQCCLSCLNSSVHYPPSQHCSAINFYVRKVYGRTALWSGVQRREYSCPIGRMLDPKAGFTILPPHQISSSSS